MKTKKFILIILIALSVVLLSGCSTMMDTVPEPAKDEKLSSLFMIYESYYSGSILVDRDTRVMYWMSSGTYNNGNLTMLVESDGSPRLWDGKSKERK